VRPISRRPSALVLAIASVGVVLSAELTAAQDLQTFTLPKPPEIIAQEQRVEPMRDAAQLPSATDRLKFTVGMGYVQAADWGNEISAAGAVKGIQLQSAALLTRGSSGLRFDNGAVSLFDPDLKWRAELGDVFSHLRGASRGARFSWSAAGNRRPAIALYGPGRGTVSRSTILSYRDQLVVREQTVLDAEVATDRSYLVKSRLAVKRLDLEAVHRTVHTPHVSRDLSLFAAYTLPGGITVSGGAFRSAQPNDRNDWRTVSLSLPLSRHLSVTLDRTFTATRDTSSHSSAAMANINAGRFRFFHRQQFGTFEREDFGSESLDRQHSQSAAAYRQGQRFDLALQMATQRTESGLVQHWEELQATASLTRSTTLRVASSVPDFDNRDRFRAWLRQGLPGQFALQAEYGRLSAFQHTSAFVEDRPRFKLMLYKSWNLATPARGAVVHGRVFDHTGRPVAGARVQLGRYHVDTDANGTYLFRHVPRGDYQLSLVPALLPADYAWDGRRVQLSLTPFQNVTADLLVAPLNSLHGRVYIDRNQNGRYDRDEGLARAVLHLDDRVTSSDDEGAYSFFNLNPGSYTVRLNTGKLPTDVEAHGTGELTVTLGDSEPAVNVEFKLLPKSKPIILQTLEQ
jgi:hypothetical protein